MKTKLLTTTIAFLLGMGMGQNAHADLKDGLVAHYSFDDCTAKDNSGNGNDGKIKGILGITADYNCVDGIKNKALFFNKKGYVWFPYSLNNFTEFSVSLWSTDDTQMSPFASMAVTYDKNEVKIYSNGNLTDTYKRSGLSFGSFNGENLSFNGGNPLLGGDGLLDEASMYNRALTEAEVLELYNGKTELTYTPEPDPTPIIGTMPDPKLEASGLEDENLVPEVLNVEPWDAIKNKYTVFTISGLNLTQDNIEFELDDCVAANRDEEKNFLFRDTTKKFRCMPTSTGEKRGRVYDTKTGKLLYSFQIQVAPKLPKVSSVTPTPLTTTVPFNSNVIFTVKGSDLSSDLVYSLNNCVNLQELAGGTAKQRSFQCTTKNSAGKQTGSITLSDGTEIKKFSVTVSSKKPPVIKNASLIYDPNIMYSWRVNFPQGQLTDIANFSSATPWQIKANDKKIYSGTLGSSFNEQIGFNSGKSTLTLDDGGELEIFWDKQTINFQANKKLNQLVSALTAKSTIEFVLGSTKASFVVNVPKTSKQVEVKTAQWSYDARDLDRSDFLTANVIQARNNLLDKYVYADIERNVRFLDALNMKTINANEAANDYADYLGNTISAFKIYGNFKERAIAEAVGEVTKLGVVLAVKNTLGDKDNNRYMQAFGKLFNYTFENALDFGSGDFVGVAVNLSLSAYTTWVDTIAAFHLNDRLENIYENKIAREVIKQYFAKGGSIYDLGGQLISVKTGKNLSPPERNWENAITVIASNMDCRVFVKCEVGYFSEDYNPEAVNQIIQNYLATLRLLSGYGDFYTLNGE